MINAEKALKESKKELLERERKNNKKNELKVRLGNLLYGTEPCLTDVGFSYSNKSKLYEEKIILLNKIDDIMWTMEWLDKYTTPKKLINEKFPSHHLKDIAEIFHPLKCITNGVFITSAILYGYYYRVIYHYCGNSAIFNISSKIKGTYKNLELLRKIGQEYKDNINLVTTDLIKKYNPLSDN